MSTSILQSVTANNFGRFSRILALGLISFRSSALDIQLPPETGAFKQDAGADVANGQCLVCHSVEYVTTQPKMPQTFWKAEVVKMQQKYGAAIPDSQVDEVVAYLTRNYGVSTNGTAISAARTADGSPASTPPAKIDPTQLAQKYGCFGCHNPETKIIGPAYRDVAAKYKSDSQARAKIEQQIRNGGSGKWGPVIMPPFPKVSAAEVNALTDWILGLK
jgi:cytochrome c551/c552